MKESNVQSYNKRVTKYKNILEWVESLSIPEREKIIDEIQIDKYFEELEKCEVVKD